MPIPALLALAGAKGLSSAFSNIGKAKQDARQQAMLADRERLYREQAALERGMAQRTGQGSALNTRLGYLDSAQADQSRLAAQRLAAMDLGRVQDFEQQQAMREGMSDVARDYDPTATAGSPMARALAGRAPNLARAITGDRYRESVGEGRTQESIRDYLARVEELRRDPNLDAESRAALDRLDALMAQELPGISTQASRPQGIGVGGVLAAVLGGALEGAGSYYGNRDLLGGGGGTSFSNRMPYGGDAVTLGGRTTGVTGMPSDWRLPRGEFVSPTAPTSPYASYGDVSRYYRFGQ